MTFFSNEIRKAIRIFIIADIVIINKCKEKIQGLCQFGVNHLIYELHHRLLKDVKSI